MNTDFSNTEAGPLAYSHKMETYRDVVVANQELYGMSELEYKVYLQDCKESVAMCTDIHHYLTSTPNVANYLF